MMSQTRRQFDEQWQTHCLSIILDAHSRKQALI